MKKKILDNDKLAKGWIDMHYTKNGSKEYNELFWAFDGVCDLLDDDPETLWEIILRIFDIDKSTTIMENLSAVPLEDLLAQHGHQ